MPSSEEKMDLEDESPFHKTYWLVSKQFDDSKMGQMKSALVACSIATAVLCFMVATTVYITSPVNVTASLFLGITGFVVIFFVWYLALGHFDWLLEDDFDKVFGASDVEEENADSAESQ